MVHIDIVGLLLDSFSKDDDVESPVRSLWRLQFVVLLNCIALN